jgi:hypothetical protein
MMAKLEKKQVIKPAIAQLDVLRWWQWSATPALYRQFLLHNLASAAIIFIVLFRLEILGVFISFLLDVWLLQN